MWRAWSWRATAWAVRSGMRRGFWTARPRLPKCRDRRAEEGLLEPAGTRTTTRRMGQQREAEAMGRMARNTGPNAPPQRTGKGAAGARVSPCARRGGWGSAGVVLAPAMAPPRSADARIRGRGLHRVADSNCAQQATSAQSSLYTWRFCSKGRRYSSATPCARISGELRIAKPQPISGRKTVGWKRAFGPYDGDVERFPVGGVLDPTDCRQVQQLHHARPDARNLFQTAEMAMV
jgi:hypothetical protein